jgi:hypothetical protein
MCEKLCQNCKLFKPEEMPEGIKKLSKDVFFDEEGNEKEISPAQLLFGLATSGISSYGKRGCEEMPTSTVALANCIHEDLFIAKTN